MKKRKARPAQQQGQTLHPQQVAQAAAVGLQFFSLDSTLIPGNKRKQIAVLEAILQLLASGQARLATPEQLRVQSKPQRPGTGPSDANGNQGGQMLPEGEAEAFESERGPDLSGVDGPEFTDGEVA